MCGLKSQVIQQQGCYQLSCFPPFFTKYYINAQAVNKLTNLNSQSKSQQAKTQAVNKPTNLNTLVQWFVSLSLCWYSVLGQALKCAVLLSILV